ncbi:hypothetical protein XENOCAPTIV_018507 [Xenoophorus captivus]|uniref:UHRF1 binding protein 1 n=1 Tax=Xenoophorus captivus TaxID=1517983 RepID=A0ABV0RWI8_9TELE
MMINWFEAYTIKKVLKVGVQLNSLQLCVDAASLLWISLFSRGLLQTLDQVKAFYHLQDSKKAEEHVDIRMDAAQLKLIIPLDSSILDHPERPQSLSVIVLQMALSNTRHCPHGSTADLSTMCEKFTSCSFFQSTPPYPYPRDQSAFHPIPSAFLRHFQETKPQPLDRKQLRSQDIWSLSMSRVTLGFDGARQFPKGKTQPFIEPFAMSGWMCQPSAFKSESWSSSSSPDRDHHISSDEEPQQGDASLASIHFLVHTITPLKMWLNHYQYVALLRMKDAMIRLGAELSQDLQGDKQTHGQKTRPPTVCLALLVDSVELGLLLPPASAGPEDEVPQTPETDSPSMTDSDLSPTHRSVDGILEDSGLENGISSINRAAAALDQDDQDGVVEQAYEAVEEEENGLTTKEETPGLSPPLSAGPSPVISRESSTFSLEGELSSAISVTKDATKDAISASLDLTKGAFSITKDAFSMLSRGSGMSKLFSAQVSRGSPAPGTEGGSSADLSSSLSQSTDDDCQAELLASTVTNIGPFLEDEFSVDGQPVRLHLSNVAVTFKDDGPRIYPTAPQPVPAKFIIDQMLLQRSDDGIMRIKGEGEKKHRKSEGANTKPSADVPAAGFDTFNGSDCGQQQTEGEL